MNQFDLLNSNSLDSIYSAADNVSNGVFMKKYRRMETPIHNNNQGFRSKNIKADIGDNFPYETNLPDRTQHINKILSNNDRSTDRYRKYINTTISIDSLDRDIRKYPRPNKYQMCLNKHMKNIVSISLLDIKIPNTMPTINWCNNKIEWCLTGCNEENNENTNLKTRIPIGFYTLNELTSKIKEVMTSTNNSTGCGKPIDYYIDVSKRTHITQIITRQESVSISEISTLNTGSNELIIITDGYINYGISDVFIPTNIPSIGGLPKKYINNKKYEYKQEIDIVDINTENIPTYEYSGTGPYTGSHEYVLRIFNNEKNPRPILATTKVNYEITTDDIFDGKLSDNWPRIGRGIEISLKNSCDSVLNVLGWSYVENKNEYIDCLNNSENCKTNCNVKKIYNNCVNSGNTELEYNKCLDICGQCYNCINKNGCIKFNCINTNINHEGGVLESCCVGENNDDFYRADVPYNYLQIDNDGYIRGENYIFMRLKTCSRSEDVISNNIIKATGYKTNYVNTNDIFAKIILTSSPNDLSNFFITNRKIFYFNELNEIDNLIIEFIDRNGNPIQTISNHHITLGIMERINVLNNTNFDSRTGDVIDMGEDDTLGNLFN